MLLNNSRQVPHKAQSLRSAGRRPVISRGPPEPVIGAREKSKRARGKRGSPPPPPRCDGAARKARRAAAAAAGACGCALSGIMGILLAAQPRLNETRAESRFARAKACRGGQGDYSILPAAAAL